VPLQQFERPRFFSGKLLTAEDLQGEQDYHRNKARLHNRFLHGWGVVDGLSASINSGEIVVSPGFALDCEGNELILTEKERLSLPSSPVRQWVVIRYAELLVNREVPLDGDTEPSWIKETVVVELSPTNPLAGHGGRLVQRTGCGMTHALSLASVIQRGGRWRITPVKSRVHHGNQRS
jgi:hypothetical protein